SSTIRIFAIKIPPVYYISANDCEIAMKCFKAFGKISPLFEKSGTKNFQSAGATGVRLFLGC
ncbi:MAG: hypothetical protein J6C75_03975, partial [Oscillospiraceae bacterium]|nr:hypothetical protein [Oscillospiraceae bacterium]